MGKDSKIAWTDHTFNPVWGCAKVSPGCDNCYAEKTSNRFGNWWGVGGERREFGDKHWNDPVRWNKAAKKAGVRTRVFCASMADVFDKDWPDGTRERLFALIKATPHLDWILVTKRIGNAKKMLPTDWGNGYQNVWLLITVVNQEEAARDCPKLRNTPAAVRGLSVEPQIGRIDFSEFPREDRPSSHWFTELDYLDWVICGAESGNGRRPFNTDWARLLRDQCVATGVSFFLKQMPADTRKGVEETPELDGQRWTELPKQNGRT